MAIAELFIGAFISVLVGKLASGDLIKLARSAGIYPELNKWTRTLKQIQAVLVDAGQKHIRDEFVQLWLNKLQHLAYEIDDILDDLDTEAKRHQLDKKSDASTSNNTSKVLKFIPNKFHSLKYGHKMSSKLDEITIKLSDLVKEKKDLGLIDNVERSYCASRRLEETSLVDESKIIGRQGDKEVLLRKLLGSESSSSEAQNVSVVSIVGLGGIGKTTLAQLLYNDEKVKEHFELRAWVCISDEFDVFNISNAILRDIGGDGNDIKTLNQLQVALTEKVSKKRFLIVLDDVWNENYNEWELLQRPFNVGAPGSKILVTTRKTIVASLMDSVEAYPLDLLSHEEALTLFVQHASGKQNFNVHQTLKLYGEDIVKRCGRLPLALRTLGRLFRTKSNVEEWEELLDSEVWNLQNGSKILPALRLSYYDLPPHLKQMFVYCFLFPKDYMFDKDELVLLWMAEGFLSNLNEKKSMESSGRQCLEELVARSLFQHSNNDKSRYTMHDLIHELATSVAGEFFFIFYDKIDVSDTSDALEKLHHLSFIRDEYEANKKFKALHRTRRLRTFLALSVTRLKFWQKFYLSNKVLVALLPQLQFLRVLSLANYSIEEIPHSIGSLKHLRYLNFSNTMIKCLPEQVGYLHNLQSLLLSGCPYLSRLPNSIVKLINLRHLDISDTPQLAKFPLGIGGLTGLQTVSKVIIGGAGEFRISDLKGFLHLCGQLSIEGLQTVKDALHAKEANYAFPSLEVLNFKDMKGWEKWSTIGGEKSRVFPCLHEISIEKCPKLDVVKMELIPSLRVLHVKECSLAVLGAMVGVSSLIARLTIENIEGLTQLRGNVLQHLKAIEYLNISNCDKLTCLWESEADAYEILGGLQKLRVNSCANLVSLGEKEVHLKSVTEVKIEYCQSLQSYSCPNNIEKFVIRLCPSATSLSFPTMDSLPSSLKFLEIMSCNNMEVSWLVNKFLSSLESLFIFRIPKLRLFPEGCLAHLTKLSIFCCHNIESIPDNGYGFFPFFGLSLLEIYNCKKLKSFPHEQLQRLTSLKAMEISYCPSLDYSFPSGLWPPNLSWLEIGGLKKPISEWGLQNFPTSLVTLHLHGPKNSGLVSFGANAEEDVSVSSSSFLLPSSLTSLHISYFKELESLSEGLQHLNSLKELEIIDSPKLRDLPETLLPSLLRLKLYNPSPKLIKKCRNKKGKYSPIISQIPSVEIVVAVKQ